jgi:hypothetical protein
LLAFDREHDAPAIVAATAARRHPAETRGENPFVGELAAAMLARFQRTSQVPCMIRLPM